MRRSGAPAHSRLPGGFAGRGRRFAAACLGLVLLPLVAGVPAGAMYRPWLSASYRRPAPPTGPVRVTATAAVLMDARSGQVLYGRNPHLVWPPASTTKILTALVALQSAPLDKPILITPEVARFRVGSVVGLPEGARIPLHDLLYGLMLQSGNDVALAIAEGVAGSVPAFVARMNAEARRLGARQTHFTSPHGLYDPNHYTTAYDLALIARAAMANPVFREIVRTRRWTFRPPGGPPRVLWNHNRLLSRYPGADGVKTGYVNMSGETLVASATRNGWRLIVAELHSEDIWGDAARLLTYGFDHFHSVALARAGEEMAAVQVTGGDRLVLGVVPKNVYAALSGDGEPVRRVAVAQHLAPPVRRGETIGEVRFYLDGRVVQATPLVAARAVTSQTDFDRVVRWVGRMVDHVVGTAVL